MSEKTKRVVAELLGCLNEADDKEEVYKAIIESIDKMFGYEECYRFGQVVSDYLYDDDDDERE